MIPERSPAAPTRQQPHRASRSAGPPKPIYVPEVLKPRARTNAGVKKGNTASNVASIKPRKPAAARRKAKQPSPKKKKKKKKKGRGKRLSLGSMDFLLESSSDLLARQDRWIPDLGQRPQAISQPPVSQLASELWMSYSALDDYVYAQSLKDSAQVNVASQHEVLQRGQRVQPSERPSTVDGTLWGIYRLLEAWVYRASLTAEQAVTHPLLDDVLDYQCDGGDTPPIAPEGWEWIGRELIRTKAANDKRECKIMNVKMDAQNVHEK
ncbi:hypothetical protein BKA67DRAFT_305380 [Truncatella angustata]|uniref:Uncharacterized protein n=1 Tax=Truncatella angustata TaxID=152316 RepID=A0A9P8UIS2_9PEZI|nr:uncharacterized protein BKA67DRAFT_305380 [Truncatella angustata]KAH6652946.1 hypothetical protein BKA67DRAFT_305380 [Truncatella angustata]